MVAAAAQKTAEEERDRADRALGQAEANLYASRIPLAYAEWRNNFIDRAETLLDGYLFSDQRGWEWYYLKGLCHRDLRTLPARNASFIRPTANSWRRSRTPTRNPD